MNRKTSRGTSKDLQKKYKSKQVIETSYYTVPPLDVDDKYFITQYGDRLDLLAQEFYGNRRYWWFIALVNNLTTVNIDPGIKIRIPKKVSYVY
tara:strand:+ start:624 stop:902 length:279 start_codon:yes stop_codon:yes gene_type:complete